jgi:hypothetical protein
MGAVKNSFKEGFGGTLGSFSAMAIFGLVVVIGIVLIMKARAQENKPRNTPLMMTGIVLLVLGSLPFAPLVGISILPNLLNQEF